ncbi:PHP domain-containing protein [Caproiciproducens sp. R1]|uniref:PHP domain-containing protein n=1 Tax=Caproiciproducens sp. R1 TaxID=3435000 RepID=UPI004034C23C
MVGDLHTHSRKSDGSMYAADIVAYAKRVHLDYLALTDHDTMAGVPLAEEAGKELGVCIIPGVEISTKDYQRGLPVHMLCYFPKDTETLQKELDKTLLSRAETKKQMIEKIRKIYPVTWEYIERFSRESESIYESHIMQALADHGYTNTVIGSLKDDLISKGGSCYVPNAYPDTREVLRLIHDVGGLAVVAHPGQFHSIPLCAELAEKKQIVGIEYAHPRNTEEVRASIQSICTKYGLIMTGGSDFHGQFAKSPHPLGSFVTQEPAIQKLIGLSKKPT